MRERIYHLPLTRPWTWALTDAGLRCLFFAEEEQPRDGRPGRRHPLHPAPELMGALVAVYALPSYDSSAPAWVEKATGLRAPPPHALPGGQYVAVGRLVEVGTIANDARCYDRKWAGWDRWWAGASPCRGTIAWWLDEVVVFEALEYPAPPAHLPRPLGGRQGLFPVDSEALPELRERVRLALDGVWRHAPWVPSHVEIEVPAPTPEPVAPAAPMPEVEWPVLPPMVATEQLGLFAEVAPQPTPLAPPVPVDERTHVAESLRQLLADGQRHVASEVYRLTEGARWLYQVTVWGGSSLPVEPWQVPIYTAADGQGGWYAAWNSPAALDERARRALAQP